MAEHAVEGSWVEIHNIVLTADERAPQVPPDTHKVPLEMRVKGFLTRDAALGDQAEIKTMAGRRLRGKLVACNPPYDHRFGAPIPELLEIGGELRAILDKRRFGR